MDIPKAPPVGLVLDEVKCSAKSLLNALAQNKLNVLNKLQHLEISLSWFYMWVLYSGRVRIWKCWFFREREKSDNAGKKKPLGQGKNQQQTQPKTAPSNLWQPCTHKPVSIWLWGTKLYIWRFSFCMQVSLASWEVKETSQICNFVLKDSEPCNNICSSLCQLLFYRCTVLLR